MISLPKIVSQRLRREGPVGPHPDADQLTALVENSVGRLERTQILKHLSTCQDCREVLSLSLPQVESNQFAPIRVRSGWLQWPVLRWGAVAACGLVVGAAVTMHYRSSPNEAMLPAIAHPSSDGSAEIAMRAQPAPLTLKSDAKPNQLTSNQVDKLAKQENAELLHQSLQAGNHAEGQARSKDSPAGARDRMTMALESPAAPAPLHSQPAKAAELKDESKKELDRREKIEGEEPKSSNVNARAANPVGNLGAVASSEQVTVSAVPPSEPATGKAKEPQQNNGLASGAGIGQGAFRADTAVMSGLVLVPRWTLTADGTLQRSFNAGKTWETINVTTDAKLRALAAVGTEIWVGGTAGSLYHSSDAGGHWTQVKPVADGKPLIADIIGVEFTDTQHGKLTTSGGVTWTTVDGGQSWNTN